MGIRACRTVFTPAVLALAISQSLVLSAFAAPIGNLQQISAETGQVELQTDQQVRLQIQLLKPGLFRLQAAVADKSNNSTFTGPGDKAAAIVIKNDYAKVD